MADHGLRDDRLAGALADLASDTPRPTRRGGTAVPGGRRAGATAVSARLADALAMTGDCTTAGRLTDELLASDDRPSAPRRSGSPPASPCTTAASRRRRTCSGGLGRTRTPSSARRARSCRSQRVTSQAARAALSAESAGPPTSTARAARSLAEGLLLSLDQPFPVAVARLGQSITTEQQPAGVAPDSPAALVTLAALHGGDPVRARSVIGRAVRAGAARTTPSPLIGTGCCWAGCGCRTGNWRSAAADAAAVGDATLHRRDALWAAALNTAIARRSGDGGAVQKHWYAAMEVLAEYSSTFSHCCRWASCGSRPRGCVRSTGCSTPLTRRSRCSNRWAIRCCGRCRCTGRACTPESSRIRRRRSRRTARR